MNPIRHLYIHIPFCHRRCSYCDFNTYANMEDRIVAYVDALCAEIERRGAGMKVDRPADQPGGLHPLAANLLRSDLLPSIFLGGGTPTMVSAELIERALRAADAIIPLQGAEVTIEANPGTVLGRDYLRTLRDLGINRISMGVQSLHDPTLRMLGRIHTAAEARRSFEDARAAGFERINLDFIFGLPGQTLEQWEATLEHVVTWGADHFSLYSLILEEGTPLHAQVLGGRLNVPDDDVAGAMYESAMQRFAAAGYHQYEISNWAINSGAGAAHQEPVQGMLTMPDDRAPIPSQACHHNLAYWLNADYLAAGAGAHGHVFPQRYYDTLKIDEYIQQVHNQGLPTAEVIDLTAKDLYAETMFMGLRLNVGVSYAHFQDRCGADLKHVYGDEITALVEQGLLEQDSIGIRLTERGRMLGNQVFARFVG